MRRTAVLLIALLAPALHAQGVRTWVDPAGVDTNPCSRALPCRNFAAAVAAVANGGEVVVLSAGGFGAVSINKSVSIISPAGVHAAIAPTTGAAITIEDAPLGVIDLRGLYLNSQGAVTGIEIDSGVVHVEGLVISGFATQGIHSLNALLLVTDTTIRNGGVSGFGMLLNGTNPLPARTSLNRVRISNCAVAVYATDGTSVAVRDSVAWNVGTGYWVEALNFGELAEMSVENSALTGNETSPGFGIYAGGTSGGTSLVSVSNSSVAHFNIGLYTRQGDGGTIARVSNSTFVHNGTGLWGFGGILETRANNTVFDNGLNTNGTITNFPAR